ncbi:NADH:ubiquinone oxidoreductase subunit I [Candidatus Photodesmus blepharus]|uniref:NADH:ubiquinone oxidoreductase subunit I n=1 Tax=Candidatus Photodesmus blepharonis TaxID=1179155 RepID=A0A084CNH8_9GAMM|nr:cytochrome c oxidase accessory protein CcoG [Candidatus Photodesmus blepharus]KEY91357.1 NADH:ubiquinone oxidoreductase subunit I [Candidatus Photodesmus blepharus]
MNQDQIDIKDITLKKFTSSTYKRNIDRLNPSNRIYVRKSKGTFQRLRRFIATFLLLIFFFMPWVSYGERQAILLDIVEQQFNFFSVTFYPQDLTLLAFFFLIAAFGLLFLTTFFGRIWCGYLCPQTVWTFIYIWFEEKLEGPANKRRQQDLNKLTIQLVIKKTVKHVVWLMIALLTGFTVVGYFISVENLIIDFFALNFSFWSTFWVLFFSGCTYINASWMRSIICVHICPYARFQSVMFDRDTFVVSYDFQRGENRGPRSRKINPKVLGFGDCIDCDLCVQVCPTGIDIRNGLQYECINCGACVDICNKTMAHMGYKKGLIGYTTERRLSGHYTKILRPKLFVYSGVFLIMLTCFGMQLSSVDSVGLSVLRDRNKLFKVNNLGEVENTYILKIINKTQRVQEYRLNVKGFSDVSWYGKKSVKVKPGEICNLPMSLGVYPNELNLPVTAIRFVLSDTQNSNFEVESRFVKWMN